jgi:hypothetical protein
MLAKCIGRTTNTSAIQYVSTFQEAYDGIEQQKQETKRFFLETCELNLDLFLAQLRVWFTPCFVSTRHVKKIRTYQQKASILTFSREICSYSMMR